jgi:hypothetical protein
LHDNAVLIPHIDTSVARLRAQLARLDGGAEALAAIDAVGDDVNPPIFCFKTL